MHAFNAFNEDISDFYVSLGIPLDLINSDDPSKCMQSDFSSNIVFLLILKQGYSCYSLQNPDFAEKKF